MPILLLLKNNYKLVSYAVAAMVLFAYGYYLGSGNTQSKWDAEKAVQVLAANDISNKQIKTAFEIGSSYEIKRNDIDNVFNRLLKANDSISSKADATSKPHDSTCSNRVPRAVKQDILMLAREAEINTQKLIALQKWIKDTE